MYLQKQLLFLEKINSADCPLKNKVADENLRFQRHTNFLAKLQCLLLELLFISYFLFRMQPVEFFFIKKKLSNESRSV